MIKFIDGDEKKADLILEVAQDIYDYYNFRNMLDLGITIGPNDIPFERAMLFSWIKEGLTK